MRRRRPSANAKRLDTKVLGSRISFERREIDLPDIKLEQLAAFIQVYNGADEGAVFISKLGLGDLLSEPPLPIVRGSKPQAAHPAIVHILDEALG